MEKITPKRFALIIDELVRTKHFTHMEAIIYYCEQNLMEPEYVTKWIDRSLKEKLQSDFIKKSKFKSIFNQIWEKD